MIRFRFSVMLAVSLASSSFFFTSAEARSAPVVAPFRPLATAHDGARPEWKTKHPTTYTIIDLGILPGYAFEADAYSINDTGHIVGRCVAAPSPDRRHTKPHSSGSTGICRI
jgi:hypothetical protein